MSLGAVLRWKGENARECVRTCGSNVKCSLVRWVLVLSHPCHEYMDNVISIVSISFDFFTAHEVNEDYL